MNASLPPVIPLPPGLRLLRRFSFPHKLGIMDRLFSRYLASQGIGWIETSCGEEWKLDLKNSTHRWMVYGDYEGAGGFYCWVRKTIPTTGVVVDSGANIGQMSLTFAKVVRSGKIIAFEPGAEQADWLAECLARNPHLPVEIVRAGLSENQRSAFLFNDGGQQTHGSWCKVRDEGGEPIQLTTLDDHLAKQGIRHVDLWKMDMEGHEPAALRGAAGALRAGAIGALYVELSGGSGTIITELLGQFGYRPFFTDASGRPYPALTLNEYENVLFLQAR